MKNVQLLKGEVLGEEEGGGVIAELPGLKLKSHVINIYFFGSGKNSVGGGVGYLSININSENKNHHSSKKL